MEHVKDIYEALVEFRDLKDDPATQEKFGDEWMNEIKQIKKRESLLPDLHALIADFKEFVDNKCIIRVS